MEGMAEVKGVGKDVESDKGQEAEPASNMVLEARTWYGYGIEAFRRRENFYVL